MDDIIIPRSFFMLQQLQRDWGTRDTWTRDRSFWARKNYRWVLLDSFLIRFLIPPSRLPSRNPLYHLHSFPSVSDINSEVFLLRGWSLPRSSYKPPFHRVYNGFVPSLSALIFSTIKYLPRARVSSRFYVTSTYDGIHCCLLNIYRVYKKPRSRAINLTFRHFISLLRNWSFR